MSNHTVCFHREVRKLSFFLLIEMPYHLESCGIWIFIIVLQETGHDKEYRPRSDGTECGI